MVDRSYRRKGPVDLCLGEIPTSIRDSWFSHRNSFRLASSEKFVGVKALIGLMPHQGY